MVNPFWLHFKRDHPAGPDRWIATAVIGLLWFLLALFGATLLLHAIARLWYVPVSARLFGQTPWLPSVWCPPAADGEPFEAPAADGTAIRGTYLPRRAGRREGIVLFCHELNGDRWNATPYVEPLRRIGLDVFTFDFRNHGASGRTEGYQPMPWVSAYDVADVRAVLDYVTRLPDADPRRIGLIGVSKGASASLCVAAGDPRVAAVVLDSVCPTEQMQGYCARSVVSDWLGSDRWGARLPAWALGSLGTWAKLVIGWRRHCRFMNMDRAARRLRTPVLLIHGQCDAHIPVELVRSWSRRMRGTKELWIVPRAKHAGAILTAREEYHRRVSAFLLQHLAGVSPALAAGQLSAPVAPRASTGAVAPPRPEKALSH